MNARTLRFFLFILICIFCHSQAYGGWGDLLKSAEQFVPQQKAPGSDETEAQAIIKDYIAYSSEMVEAQRLMCLAFGLKEDAEKLRVEREVLASGNVTTSSIKAQRMVSSSAQEKIDQMVVEEKELAAGGKEHYKKSLLHYGVGVLKAVETSKRSEKFYTQTAKSLDQKNWLQGVGNLLGAMGIVKFIGPIIPQDLKNSLTTLPRYFTYAKSKKIKIPQEASQASNALGALGG